MKKIIVLTFLFCLIFIGQAQNFSNFTVDSALKVIQVKQDNYARIVNEKESILKAKRVSDAVTPVYKTVTVTSGNLAAAFSATEKSTVTNLTIKGTIDVRDFKYMRDSLSKLSVLDFSAVAVTAYTGTGGTSLLTSTSYAANSIPDRAFENRNLTSVVIPNSVTSIGSWAFEWNMNLKSFTIPTTVTSIGESAFSGCTGLTSIVIPSSIKNFGYNAFNWCTGLTSVTLTPGLSSIGGSAFWGCSGLTSVTIPTSVTTLGGSAFSSCTGLTSITIPSSITTFEGDVFFGCTGLKTVTLSTGLTSIGRMAFTNCTSLTSVTIPASVAFIGDYAFSGSPVAITLASASPYFTLDNQILFNKAKTKLLFYPTSKTGSYIIPSSVNTIAPGAFLGCTGLVAVTIPSSIVLLGDEAFSGCTGLASIYCNSATPIDLGSYPTGVFYNVKTTNCTLYVPTGSKSLYQATLGWKDFRNYAELSTIKTVTTSSGNLLSLLTNTDLNSLNELYITGTIDARDFKTIRDNLNALKRIDLSNASIVEYSGTEGTKGAANITYPANTIPSKALYNKRKLTYLTLPKSIVSIENSAFSYCDSLLAIQIPTAVTNIGDSVFFNCSALTTINTNSRTPVDLSSKANVFINVNKESCTLHVPLTLKQIYANASGWKDFKNINDSIIAGRLSESLSSGRLDTITTLKLYGTIDARDFIYMRDKLLALKTVDLSQTKVVEYTGKVFDTSNYNYPENTIPDHAFYKKTKLKSIVFPLTATVINSSAFSGCTGLTSINIPTSVTSIESSAFYDCANMSTIVIPASVISIGTRAFSGCGGSFTVSSQNQYYSNEGGVLYNKNKTTLVQCLTSISRSFTIPSSVISINEYAFRNCTISSIVIPALITSIGSGAFDNCNALTTVNFNAINYSQRLYSSYSVFGGCNSFTTLIIGENVNTIPDYAFAGCATLNGPLSIPASVTTVGNCAFSGCKTLSSIKFNATKCINMGSSVYPVFNGCTSLDSLTIGENVTTIADYAFYGCNRLKNQLTIPHAVTSIGSNAFTGCDSITTINYNATKCTSTGVFFSLPLLKNVVVGENVSTIPAQAFTGCDSISTVTFNAINCTSLGGNYISAFANKSHLKNVNIGDKVTTIPANAFRNCDSIANIVVPDKVVSVGLSAFNGCDGLTYVSLGNGVTSVADSAFSKCTKLANVTLGTSVSSLGAASFGTCQKIRKITCLGEVPADCNSNSFGITDYERSIIYGLAKLYVPSTSSTVYSMVAVWREFANRFTVGASTDAITITPADNTAVISWSQNSEATSYKMIIYGDINRTVRICTLSFNATGQLTSIAFVRSVYAKKEAEFSFTVSGLKSGTTYQYTMTGYNSTNDVVSVKQGTFTTTGISALSNTSIQNIAIYPNPIHDIFHVNGLSDNANLQMLDLNGRVVFSKQVTNKESVSISFLPQGLYIVKLLTTEGIVERKVIKK